MPPDSNNNRQEQVYECACCSEEFDNSNEMTMTHDGDICESCIDEHYYACANCSEYDHIDNSYSGPDSNYYCEDCRCDLFTWCCHCDETMWYDDSYETPNGDMCCSDCYDEYECNATTHMEEAPTDVRVSYIKSEKFKYLKVNRLVGIEAELRIPEDTARDEQGDMLILREVPMGWRAVHDGSINGEGRELISSPTNGDLLRQRVYDLYKFTSRHGLFVDKSCGLHLHFDATDTDWNDLRWISIVAQNVEQNIFSMLPPSRENSNWCREVPMSFHHMFNCSSGEEFIEDYYSNCNSSISREKYNDARYQGTNLHARFYLGTVEFRYHSGTLNPTKILMWIELCNAIIETGLYLARYDRKSSIYRRLWDFFTAHTKNDSGYMNAIDRNFIDTLDNLLYCTPTLKKYIRSRVLTFNSLEVTRNLFNDNNLTYDEVWRETRRAYLC